MTSVLPSVKVEVIQVQVPVDLVEYTGPLAVISLVIMPEAVGNTRVMAYGPQPWYTPNSPGDKKAFDDAKCDLKMALLPRKEGISTTKIINFLRDVGIEIPHERFGLNFNQFLYHCQDCIQIRKFHPGVSASNARFVFFKASSADADTRHLLDLVRGQLPDKKKPGQIRPTLTNTIPENFSFLLGAAQPHIFDTPPRAVGGRGRGGALFAGRYANRGGIRSPNRGPMSSPINRAGMLANRRGISTPPRGGSSLANRGGIVANRGGRIVFGDVGGRSIPTTSRPAVPVDPPYIPPPTRAGPSVAPNPATPPPVARPTTNGYVPTFPMVLPTVFKTLGLPAPPVSATLPPPPTRMVHHDVTSATDQNPARKPEILSPLAETKTIKITIQNPVIDKSVIKTVHPEPVIEKPKEGAVDVQIPEGYVHPAKACSMDVNWTWLKKRMAAESFGDYDNLLKVTITDFKAKDPGTFSILLEDFGEVSRLEGMMNIFYTLKPENQPKVRKEEVILNGIYAAWDKNRKVWCRVQVMNIHKGGDNPLTVFLIDHGSFLDLECSGLRYLKSYHTSVMRYAYFASFAYLPDEPRMLSEAACYFMYLSVGKEWMTYLVKVETREDGPRLMIRLGMNLAMAGIGETKLRPIGTVY